MQPSTPVPIGLLAAAVRRAVKATVLARVGALGLGSQQFWFLVAVHEHPGLSQCELAAALRMDEPTASRALRSLATHGWIRTLRAPSDRRRVRVELTATGEVMVRRCLPVARELRAMVEAPLTPRERDLTRAALEKIVAHLRKLAEGAAEGRTA